MIANLQLLRVIAAMMIVAVHLQPLLYPIGYHETANALYAGVDIFFMISGFIMVHIVDRRETTAREFLFDRIVRIVPVYWLLTIVLFGVSMLLPVRTGPTPTFIGMVGSLAFIPGAMPPQYMPTLFVGWTLNLEIYFYALFAFSLALGLGNGARLAFVAAAIIGVCVLTPTLPDASRLRFYGMPIAAEFAIGMAIARLHPHLGRIPIPAGGGLAIAGVVWLVYQSALGTDHTSLGYAGPAAFIVIAALALDKQGHRIETQLVMRVAAASYALYVAHPLVISAFVNLQRRLPVLQAPTGAASSWVAALISSIVFAVLVHTAIEIPMMRWLKAQLGPGVRVHAPTGA